MHHLRLARHVALGALLAGTVAVGAPSLASAASTCTFDYARKEMTVIHDAPSGKLTLTSAATLQFRDGSGVTQSCYSPQGVAATASNVDTILVKASKTWPDSRRP